MRQVRGMHALWQGSLPCQHACPSMPLCCSQARSSPTPPPNHRHPHRAPFLLHNAATRRALAAAGFLYDSSLPDTAPSDVSPSVRQRAFPYRMDAGIPQTCETGGLYRAAVSCALQLIECFLDLRQPVDGCARCNADRCDLMLCSHHIAGSCSASERWPLWEVPLWAAADAAGRPIASMDPAGDAYEIYKREVGYCFVPACAALAG